MPRTLLLADDSVTIQKVVGISLASEDVALVTVDNGDDALVKARELRPDVVLADCVMPGRSGYEVAEAIAGDPALRHIPVLLLTGTFEAFDEERAARCGAAGHIAKPFEAQTLLDEVHRLFAVADGRRTQAPKARPAPAAPAARAPVAAPAAAPVRPAPAPEPVASVEEGFDFFDEDLDDLMPAALVDEPSIAGEREVELDSSESAFAFASGSTGRAPRAREPQSSLIGEEDLARLDADATPPLPRRAERPAVALDETRLDFGPGASGRRERASAALPVDDGDLAGETVLDPNASDGFDVSASDLGDPYALDEPEAQPARPEPARRALELVEPPLDGDGFDSGTLDASGLELLEPEPEPPAPPAFPEDRDLVLEPAPERTPPRAPEPEPEIEPEAAPELEPRTETEARFEASSDALDDERPEPARPRAGAAHAFDVEALARSAVEAAAPRLRTELHDALEKAAWESLSDVTDQIVRHAVERIEAIAWEVIPQMTETLIREEIRRMKGEDGV